MTTQSVSASSPSLVLARKLAVIYWKRLIQFGIPMDDAVHIAIAIARYDVASKRPRSRQRVLIDRYCPLVCRAELWRPGLLIN
jgi:hypothetical protein